MSNYCDFNPKLFKPFTSKKKRIIPAMSDDWEIINESFRGDDGLGIGSVKLNSEIHDIPVSRFLRFCKEQNISIIGNILQGSFIVGNDRSIYTQDTYDEWKAKFDVRTEVIIKPADYKIGHEYKTPCGMELVYLGWRYVSTFKTGGVNFGKISKITKKHFVILVSSPDIFTQKFTKDLGKKLTKKEAEDKLQEYYDDNINVVYFGKESCNDPKYGIIADPTTEPGNLWKTRSLIVKAGGRYYVGKHRWGIGIYGSDDTIIDVRSYRVIDNDLNTTTHYEDGEYWQSLDKKIEGTFRIGIVQ